MQSRMFGICQNHVIRPVPVQMTDSAHGLIVRPEQFHSPRIIIIRTNLTGAVFRKLNED